MAKDKEGLPSGYVYCNGCGHEHNRKDLVSICVQCLQMKFIPRLNWESMGFLDRKSAEQWWNHTKKVNIKALEKELEKAREEFLAKKAWLDPAYNDAEEDDRIVSLPEL